MSEATTVNETVINQIAQDANSTALDKGFWQPPTPFLTEICTKLLLIVSEVSEAMEELRREYEGEVNGYTQMTEEQGAKFLEELMDILIRTFDLAYYLFGNDAGLALLAKMAKNSGRPRMHGAKRF